jgi:outer membrane receptor for ferrienterochelin and colicins
LPELLNGSIGTNLFFLPSENQKLEISLSYMYEFRFGGDMSYIPGHFSLQSEE